MSWVKQEHREKARGRTCCFCCACCTRQPPLPPPTTPSPRRRLSVHAAAKFLTQPSSTFTPTAPKSPPTPPRVRKHFPLHFLCVPDNINDAPHPAVQHPHLLTPTPTSPSHLREDFLCVPHNSSEVPHPAVQHRPLQLLPPVHEVPLVCVHACQVPQQRRHRHQVWLAAGTSVGRPLLPSGVDPLLVIQGCEAVEGSCEQRAVAAQTGVGATARRQLHVPILSVVELEHIKIPPPRLVFSSSSAVRVACAVRAVDMARLHLTRLPLKRL